MGVADLNGDGHGDLFYSGLVFLSSSIISRLHLRCANDSLIPSTGLDATRNYTLIAFSSYAAVDIDSDGDIDLIFGGTDASNAKIMTALLNSGSGIFSEGTAAVFGSLPGFDHGAFAVAHLTNDSMPDLINIGIGSFAAPVCFSSGRMS